MFKMGSQVAFEYLKHKLWPKERQFDFLKSLKFLEFRCLKWDHRLHLST
jgi:hypothetical protein